MESREREANYGEKMIEVKVRFWTDSIASEEGKIIPKVCWEHGVIRIKRNDAHGIIPKEPLPFNAFTEILPRIEQILKSYGIKVVRKETAKGLYTTQDKVSS